MSKFNEFMYGGVGVTLLSVVVLLVPLSDKKKSQVLLMLLWVVTFIAVYKEFNQQQMADNKQFQNWQQNLELTHSLPFFNQTTYLKIKNPVLSSEIQIFHSIPRDGKSSYFIGQVQQSFTEGSPSFYFKIKKPITSFENAVAILFQSMTLEQFLSQVRGGKQKYWFVVDNLEKSISGSECYLCLVLGVLFDNGITVSILMDNKSQIPTILQSKLLNDKKSEDLKNHRVAITKFNNLDEGAISSYIADSFKTKMSTEDLQLLKQQFNYEWLIKYRLKKFQGFKELWNSVVKDQAANLQNQEAQFIRMLYLESCQEGNQCSSINLGKIRPQFSKSQLKDAIKMNIVDIQNGQISFADQFWIQVASLVQDQNTEL